MRADLRPRTRESDAVPAAGCVGAMLAEVNKCDAVMPYTNCSHVGGTVVSLSDGRPYDSLRTSAVRSKIVASALAADVIASARVPDTSAMVESVDTFFLMLRREVAETLGRFDGRIFHRDARMDTSWWGQSGDGRFRASVAANAFCFHYGGLTLDSIFGDRKIPSRTNDLILMDAGAPVESEGELSEDDLRNRVMRFDAEVKRSAAGPVFGMPIHLLHIGEMDPAIERWRGIFESCSVLMPEDSADRYNEVVDSLEEPWVMVLKAGEMLHESALPGLKRLTNEPHDAAEFPFMYYSADKRRCLASHDGSQYPFGEVRLFRRDSGCRVRPGGEVTCGDEVSVRRCGQLSGEAVLQHIFQVAARPGKWLDIAPHSLPSVLTDGGPGLPSVSIAAAEHKLSVAIAVPTLDLKKPVHRSSRMASFGLRDAVARHPNVSTVDCYDGEWFGKTARNDRLYAAAEDHHMFVSVDEMRSAPDIKGCARICWLTTARFSDTTVTPELVASLGYDKYFVSGRRMRDELRKIGCDCDFLPPSVASGSHRQFTKISARCQVGVLLRARPADWDPDLLGILTRLRDIDCRVFGHGWADSGKVKREVSAMPRANRAKLVALLDEVIPLLGQPVAAGQESVLFSSARCLLHVPSPQDAKWGFVPHSVCEALAAGTPAVVLDKNGQLEARDFCDAPVYLERTVADAAQRAADIASMSFDELSILSEQARSWAAANTHDHRAAMLLAAVAVHPGERVKKFRGTLTVKGGPFSQRLIDRIRFQAGLQGIEDVVFEAVEDDRTDAFRAEFRTGASSLQAEWPIPPSPSQLDGIIVAL